MSSTVQQEDVPDSGKDDDNITADAPANMDVPVSAKYEENLKPKLLDSTEKISTTAETEDIKKSVSLSKDTIDKPDEKIADLSISIDSSKAIPKPTSPTKDILKLVEEEIKEISPETEQIATTSISKVLEVQFPEIPTVYKETEIDDAYSSDIELKWDDSDDETAAPLSDDALKKLDLELGIDEVENKIEDTEETADLAIENIIENPKESSSDDDLSKTDIAIENTDDNQEKIAESQIAPAESDLKTTDTESKVDSNSDTANDILKETTSSVNVKIPLAILPSESPVSKESELLTSPVTENLITEKDRNVYDLNTISDIDTAETVTDDKIIKHDEDTTKDLDDGVEKLIDVTASKDINNSEDTIIQKSEYIKETEPEKPSEANITAELSISQDISDIPTDAPIISDLKEITSTQKEGLVESTVISENNDNIEPANDNEVTEKTNDINIQSPGNTKIAETITKPDADEFITPDVTNDSIKINTEHRINRPDVMLDIPTQEFDFDEFDETLETPSGKTDKIDSDLTSKTVTEIVNQLSKDTEKMEVDDSETNDAVSDIKNNENYLETVLAEKQSKNNQEEMEWTSTENLTEANDKNENEIKKSDPTAEKSPQSDIKTTNNDLKSAEIEKKSVVVTNDCQTKENYIKLIAIEVIEDKPSTLLDDITKLTDKIPEIEEKISIAPEKLHNIESESIDISKEINKSTGNNEKPEKVEQENIDPQPSTSAASKKETDKDETQNDEISNTANSEVIESQPSTSAESLKDIKNGNQNNDKISDAGKSEAIEPQPSTSEAFKHKKVDISENTEKSLDKEVKLDSVEPQSSSSEDVPEEVTDSLGLLAESSRVLEEDEEEQEPEDDEPDDGDADDDDDFDPDDENSNPTEEHSEESNPTHSEVDIQDDGIDIEFSNEVDKIVMDSNDTFDTLLQDKADTKEEIEDISEKSSDSTTDVEKKKKRRTSILAGLLTKPAAEMNLAADLASMKPEKNVVSVRYLQALAKKESVIDLEESSEEDSQKGKDSEETPSVVKKPKTDDDDDEKTMEVDAQKEATDKKPEEKGKSKTAEVFNLDSDEEIGEKKEVSYIEGPREGNTCINYNCISDENVPYYLADRMTIAYYGAARQRKRAVCQNCLEVVNARNEGLVSGIKDLRPLLSLRMSKPTQTLLEISDSDSEGEDEPLGEEGASLLEDQLTDMLNDVWSKYNMDHRLKETEDYLTMQLEKMQKQSEEVDILLRDCQKATDALRVEFYSSFEAPRHELPALSIHDTPIASYSCSEAEEVYSNEAYAPLRYSKRRSSIPLEPPLKKIALPESDSKKEVLPESPPPDLPPEGEPVRTPLKAGVQVYAMKNQYGAWLKGKVLEVTPRVNDKTFTNCRVRFEHKVKNPCKSLSARSIAYTEPSSVRMPVSTRVIALFKNSDNSNKRGEFYYSGLVAETPKAENRYRYLVFFDDGYAQYVEHKYTRLVYESKDFVWEEVHPFSRDFVCNYITKLPERPMVKMAAGQEVNVEWNGKWWDTKVLKVDASLVYVKFPDNRTEWIYRGSTRLKPLFAELLAAKRGDRARLPRSTKANVKTNEPYVEYTRCDDYLKRDVVSTEVNQSSEKTWDMRRQRSVAKKSTTVAQQITSAATDGLLSRVVFYTPKDAVRPWKMVPHTCGPQCQRKDVLTLPELRTYNPLTKPLLSGWDRQIVRHKSARAVMYRAPCGRRLRHVRELHRYLRAVRSDMPVDLFDFNPNTHCLAEFVLNKSNVHKKDLSHGLENVPVPCVNYYDNSLPEFCSYNTERTPTAGVPLNLDPEFLCGCDCDDDCEDRSKCACWKMTMEGAKTIGLDETNVGYQYRRLPDPLPSGIYECNSRCKCKSTCLNRVVQNPLQLKLQVFKTLNRGWGIRALNDVPKGAFICIYAGNLLTDATANLDGINEGDEYLAELDYIEVVEPMKEGYEEDIPEADKKIGKKDTKSESEEETESTESEEESQKKGDMSDGDFQPGYISSGVTKFSKRLRGRDKKKEGGTKIKEEGDTKGKEEERNKDSSSKKGDEEECITISDDEEVRVSLREPSRFAAQENMTDNKVVSKYRSVRSYFGEDEACYIMDAKVQGNIGRYLNHSCSPNVFVQNVFVDTHDPRFPWVSFFALHHIRAGTELTWNYNYDVGSVPGKVLYCYCGAPNCRGRLL